MKTLLVVPEDYKNIGGIYLPVNNYVKYLENHGYQVKLFLLPYKAQKAKAVKLYFFSCINDFNPEAIMVYGLNQAFIIKSWIPEKGNRIMIGLLIDSLLLEVSSILKDVSLGKRKIILTLKQYLYKYKENECLKYYDDCVFVSKVDLDFVKHSYKIDKTRLHYIPNGVEIPTIVNKKEFDGELRIGCLTGFSEETVTNNLLPLINDIFPTLRSQYKTLKLVLAGRGCSPEMEQYIKSIDGVEYLGFVEKLTTFYDSVDVVVTTVKKECGILNRVLEAWAYGKPVIGYRKNFLTFDYAEENKHYFVADTNEDFLRIMGNFLANPMIINKVGENARMLVSQKYTWESCGEKLCHILEGKK